MIGELIITGKQKCKVIKVFFSVLLLGIVIQGHSQQYDLREYPDDLPQPYVYSIIQDNNGYLWIGTGNGLSRYNGFSFKTFTTNDSLADNFVTCSFQKRNDIWFGHMNGEVSHYDGKAFNTVVTSNQKTSITDIENSPNGDIWASTYTNGLVKIDKGTDNPDNSIVKNQIAIYSFQFVTDNEILVGSYNGLSLCRIINSGKIELIRHFSEIPVSKTPDIIKMKNGYGYYVATENDGIYQVMPEGEEYNVFRIASKLELPGIQSIFEDSKSNLWISTFGAGLIKLTYSASGRVKEETYFNKSTGFSTNNVKIAYEDREGNIWSGNYGTGLTQITRKTFSSYALDEIRYGTSIYSIFAYRNTVWLGTEKGLIKINQTTEKILAFYSSDYGLPNDKITAIYSEQGSELWIGTENNGIYRMAVDEEIIRSYKISDGSLEKAITAITGKNNQVWIGTRKGLCNLNLTTNKIQWYTIDQGGLPHNYVNQVFIDTKDRIWVSTLGNTLAFIENGKVGKIMITSEKGLLSLGSIVEDHDSSIWVGSYGSGIFRIDTDSIANITSKEGLFSDYCYSLLADNNGNIWVGHLGGLSKIRTADLLVKSLQQYIGIENSCEFSKNAVFKDSKNRVWFGSDEGLWVYDPAMEEQSLLPPVLNITSIKVNNEEFDCNKNLILPPGNYKIKFEYIGINLTEPTNVNYKYQLAGYDQSPEKTKDRSVIYPNLNDGEYTFILWASTGDGVLTKVPLTIHIIIKTPLWKKWWFYIIVFVLVVSAAIIYIRRRDYNHHREKQILESKVKARTSELAQKNSLLSEKQEQITQQNMELQKYHNYLEDLVEERTKELLKAKNKAEESDRLKTAFLQNMSHEIRTPMNGILGFINLLKKPTLNNEYKNNYIDIINKSGERLLNTINDIIEISKIEAEQVAVHYSKVNVIEVMEYQLKFFEPEAKNKKLLLKLSEKVSDKKTFIETDNNILNNILTNLINNAIKFTQKGTIEFGNYLEGKSIIFYVKDTGVGIPADRLEAIFDRFVQADIGNARPQEGAGLGLSIVKEYLELLNGKIWVESEVGKGSTFFFSLPNDPIDKKARDLIEKASSESIPGKKLTILVAEDDDISYFFIENILKKLSKNILRATNGKDAIKLLKENPEISLILVDIKMHEMDGYELTRQIRQFNKTIPIIAQTAYALASDKEEAMKAGCNDYITKPIKKHLLIKLIRKYSKEA